MELRHTVKTLPCPLEQDVEASVYVDAITGKILINACRYYDVRGGVCDINSHLRADCPLGYFIGETYESIKSCIEQSLELEDF